MKVIAYKNLPTKLPLWPTAVVWLLLDRFGIYGWEAGAAWTLMAILWILSILVMWQQVPVDIFEKEK